MVGAGTSYCEELSRLYALESEETLRKVVVTKRGSLLSRAEITGDSTVNALKGRVSLREDVSFYRSGTKGIEL